MVSFLRDHKVGRIGLVVSVLATIAAVISLIALILPGFPFAEKAVCHPLSFPEGNALKLERYEVRHLNTTRAFPAVREFYSHVLVSQADKGEYGQVKTATQGEWVEDRLGKGEAVFTCRQALNASEIEWGCVYLTEKDEGTELLLTWYVTPTDAPSCRDFPGFQR
jgi:hypothetical protein